MSISLAEDKAYLRHFFSADNIFYLCVIIVMLKCFTYNVHILIILWYFNLPGIFKKSFFKKTRFSCDMNHIKKYSYLCCCLEINETYKNF